MIIGNVVGNVWATRKEESLNGLKLLVVQPIDYVTGQSQNSIVAVDNVGAGVGDMVIITKGSSARKVKGIEGAPIDATIVGIIDQVEIEKEVYE